MRRMLTGRAMKTAVAFASSCIAQLRRDNGWESRKSREEQTRLERYSIKAPTVTRSPECLPQRPYLEDGWHLNRRDARALQATQSPDTANNPEWGHISIWISWISNFGFVDGRLYLASRTHSGARASPGTSTSQMWLDLTLSIVE